MSGIEALLGKTDEEIAEACAAFNLPRYAHRQIIGWLYRRHATSIEEMTDLAKGARTLLAGAYEIGARKPAKEWVSPDGTKKYLFAVGDEAFVEAAYIPEEDRATLCVSVQAGCSRACRFCMTGKQGMQKNLTSGEIVNQYRSIPERSKVTNLVYMGMGEPVDNLRPVLSSLEVMTSDYGYGLSPRRITVSTVGILPGLETLIDSSNCNIAISLHSPFPAERRRLMPVEATSPLADVLALIRSKVMAKSRRISFEYILFRGVNDTKKHADELVRILHGIRCRINLIPFNGNSEIAFQPTPEEGVRSFQEWLNRKGMIATIRRSRGQDIGAACGLLSTGEMSARRRDGA